VKAAMASELGTMRVLVIGGTGRTGKLVIDDALKRGKWMLIMLPPEVMVT